MIRVTVRKMSSRAGVALEEVCGGGEVREALAGGREVPEDGLRELSSREQTAVLASSKQMVKAWPGIQERAPRRDESTGFSPWRLVRT